jgi:hypothetical protein
MIRRIAVSFSLISFAVCLMVGGWEAENPFTTTVIRAVEAMAVTLLVGLALGTMLQTMLDESVKMEREKLKSGRMKTDVNDR